MLNEKLDGLQRVSSDLDEKEMKKMHINQFERLLTVLMDKE